MVINVDTENLADTELDNTELGTILPEELTLMAAEPLRDLLHTAISTNGNLVLDASRVERLTTPCIQVLLAAGHAAEKENAHFKLQNPSQALTASLTDLGLGAELKRWR